MKSIRIGPILFVSILIVTISLIFACGELDLILAAESVESEDIFIDAPLVSGTTPTTDTTPTWRWDTPAGAVGFKYQLNSELGTWTEVDVGILEYTPASPLALGDYTLYVRALDTEGDWSISGSRNIVIVDITNGLLAYYSFTGDADDDSGNNNHATVSGATLTTDKNGNSNQAYSFDGNNDSIITPFTDSDLLNNSDWTIC